MIRRISWVKAALKEFRTFPEAAQDQMTVALRLAAHGEKADIAKPMKGLGSGVYEIALAYRGDAYRAVYARAARGRYLGSACLSEEIEERHQDPEAGN